MALRNFMPSSPVTFDPHFLNGNCYAYALTIPDAGWTDPGSLKEARTYPIEDKWRISMVFDRAVQHDGLLKIEESQITDADVILAGFAAPGYDFHFYRRHTDGSWSHKLGKNPPTILDAQGVVISDPRTANRDHGTNYSEFMGFYKVPDEKDHQPPHQE